jgi:ABC-type bacteriocin/lantibiotic exporter with double-glycine peptidase domain
MKAFQQTKDYTCGPAVVLSLLRFYGRNGEEMTLAKAMNTNDKIGTTPENMARWLQNNGFIVNWGEHGNLKMIQENLSKNIPTLIEWSDWGGHWAIAVGYDTRNTPSIDDDVIIFADPSDIHDDIPDGVTWFNAQRFDHMWYDALLFGKLMEKVFITAIPGPPQNN